MSGHILNNVSRNQAGYSAPTARLVSKDAADISNNAVHPTSTSSNGNDATSQFDLSGGSAFDYDELNNMCVDD